MSKRRVGMVAYEQGVVGAWILGLLLAGCAGGAAPPGERDDELAGAGRGSRFVVDRADDSRDGVCVANRHGTGQCNLRAALAAAATATAPVHIELAVDASIDQGEIEIDAPAGSSDYRLSVVGRGERRIAGAQPARLFVVGANVTLTLRDLTIDGFAAFTAGAIVNSGTLALEHVTLSNNRASCSDVGAQTAFATCGSGAIANYGQLTLRGARFEDNSAEADAYTAAYTFASASAGAISSSGTLTIDGPVRFVRNHVTATAVSGVHPLPGTATASAGGGAIYNGGGTLTFTARAVGRCRFVDNVAAASATSSDGQPGAATSAGGAIVSSGTLTLPDGACVFSGNQAATDPDVHLLQ